ncbi:MAG: hypothetical protein DRN00_05075 [Thermoplasmata archaeon]|nr:MAG: hypothetical protein DRN00_05075 [Thermoplasmata archaeon]
MVACIAFSTSASPSNEKEPEIIITETPKSDIGTVFSGMAITLPFKINFTSSSIISAKISVLYDLTGWNYVGSKAYVNAMNITDQICEEHEDDFIKIAIAYNITAGVLCVEVMFMATLVEGNYIFKWNYTVSATPPPGPYVPCCKIGSGTTKAVVNKASVKLVFHRGWNLIGLPFEPEDTLIEAIFAGNISYIEEIRYFYNGSWLSWARGNITNSLTHLHVGSGYWIKTSYAFTHIVKGALTSKKPILSAGWNLVSLTQLEPISPRRYLCEYDWEILLWYNTKEDRWVYYIKGIGGNLLILEPGKGYWIYIKDVES